MNEEFTKEQMIYEFRRLVGAYEKTLRRTRWIIRIVIVLCIALPTLGYLAYKENDHRTEEGRKAATAICAVQGDYVEDITQAQTFLDKARKQGLSKIEFGNVTFTTAEIKRNINIMKDRLAALSAVPCTFKEQNPGAAGPRGPTGRAGPTGKTGATGATGTTK